MTWQCYQLVYRLESPLRLGQSEVGNLQATRGYVPARVLWAALTARLTRNQGGGRLESDYLQIGASLRENLRFGYLWPCLDQHTPRYPWDDPAAFAYDFLGSFVSTSIDYDSQSALPGSLHEAEFIAPRTRQGAPVYLTGFLWAHSDIPASGWQTALSQVMLGGERRYGWGRLHLQSAWEPLDSPAIADPDRFAWSGAVPAHLRPNPGGAARIEGVIEPLVGWEAHEGVSKSMSRPSAVSACAPGAIVSSPAEFCISPQDGVWDVIP